MNKLPQANDLAILLVDDTELILDLLQEILQANGYRVVRTERGAEVPAILDRESVGLVICDVVLPDVHGVEVLRNIKQQHPDLPVIMISGQQSFDTARQVLRERALDFLVKPFGQEEVLAAVRQGFAAYYTALNQARARQEAHRRLADLVLLKQIGETASAGSTPQELFERILDSIVHSAGVEITSLMLLGEDGLLQIAAARGLSEEIIRSVRVGSGEGISGHVLATREPVLISNLEQDSRFSGLIGGPRYKTQSLLSVPIQIRDQMLGVINVNNKRSGEPFHIEDQNLLTAIAHQVALAMENFKLVNHLRQQAQTLERTNEDLVKMNKARTRLVCNLSHELKTPLTSIMGYIDLALTFFQKLSEEELRDYLGQVREEGQNLERLITGMLRLFSIESDRERWQWKAFNLGWAVSDAFQYHSRGIEQRQLHANIDLQEEMDEVYGDPEKFGIALNALVGNAVKFNRDGGIIGIKAEQRMVDDLAYIYLQIQNEGQTVPPEAQNTIFDPYTQLGDIDTEKPHGVGIGLALVKVVVNRMKGQIFLEEKDGEGTSFGLLLPTEETYGALRD